MRLCKSAIVGAAFLAVVGFLRPASAARTPSTNLLFLFLSNTAGFDTLFTISNTGSDPFGTKSAGGSCTITFYSSGSGTPVVIPGTILPGQTASFLLSTIHPGFQGYAIAQCGFAFAHGMERLSDVGTRNLAVSYPALIIPPKRTKTNESLLQ